MRASFSILRLRFCWTVTRLVQAYRHRKGAAIRDVRPIDDEPVKVWSRQLDTGHSRGAREHDASEVIVVTGELGRARAAYVNRAVIERRRITGRGRQRDRVLRAHLREISQILVEA